MITHVILFDIDGTLISSSITEDEERKRYNLAIRDVVGKEPSVIPSRFAGMVDPEVCKILLTEIGLSEEMVQHFLPRVIARMGQVYRAMEKKPALNDWVDELLHILTESPTHVLGVLTGNLSSVGIEKLAVAGIESYFSEGFYADDYFDRDRLVKDAVEACVTKYRLPDRKRVMVIGDTPLDIAAANVANASSVGIASAEFSIGQLSEAGARWVFRDLEPSKELLSALGLEQG